MSKDYTEDELDQAQQKPRPQGRLPKLPDGDSLDRLADWLTQAFQPPSGFRFEAFDRAGRRDNDPCSIRFRNGHEHRTFWFSAQSDLQHPKVRRRVHSIGDGWLRMTKITKSEEDDIWVGLCTYGRVLSETDDRDETRKWMQHLLDACGTLRGHTLVPDGRHDGLMAIRQLGEFRASDARQLGQGGETTRFPTRFVDQLTGEQYVRAGETFAFVKWVEGAERLDRAGLKARLAFIGVESVYCEDYRPPHPKLTLYRLTGELIEYVEDPK